VFYYVTIRRIAMPLWGWITMAVIVIVLLTIVFWKLGINIFEIIADILDIFF
jgi:hypothetical protein